MSLKENKLTISVVLYKTAAHHLDKFFYSLNFLSSDVKLYVIDNSPTDSLKAYIERNSKSIYIHRPDNPGYGAGHNLAISKSIESNESIYHLVINADVYFHSDIISPMIAYMDENLEVGQMMPKILNPDGSLQYLCKLCPGPVDLFVRGFAPKQLFKKSREKFQLCASGYDKRMFVPYLSGCFMLFRNESLKSVGYFDERFFMYPEDIDLTRRMAEKYKTLYFPDVVAYHEYGAASKKSLKMFIIHFYNLVKYFNKWGWFFDDGRKKINIKTLRLLKELGVIF
jgi:GT2 family glycosyltransferase